MFLKNTITFIIVLSSLAFANTATAWPWSNPEPQTSPPDAIERAVGRSQQRNSCLQRCTTEYSRNYDRCPDNPYLDSQLEIDPFGDISFKEPECMREVDRINQSCTNSCYQQYGTGQ